MNQFPAFKLLRDGYYPSTVSAVKFITGLSKLFIQPFVSK